MDEKTTNSRAEQMQSSSVQTTAEQKSTETTTRPAKEHREVYGTAKTENLKDSGVWRVILPALVIIFCIILFIIPLMILIPLLYNSIQALSTPHSVESQLIWLWISMIVIVVGAAIVIAKGMLKTFLTQAGNYQS